MKIGKRHQQCLQKQVFQCTLFGNFATSIHSLWTLIRNCSVLYKLCFYSYATYVKLHVFLAKPVKKCYKGCHSFISVHLVAKILRITDNLQSTVPSQK